MIMITRFYDVCIDIILELLTYFNVHEIFYSFCLLIPCLPTLLINGCVQLHVRSNNSYFIKWILPHIQLTQVISLNVPIRPYNPSIFKYSSLRSLVLHDIDDPLLLFKCNKNWPPYHLEHLSLYIRNQDIPNKPSNIGTRVLEQALQLLRLKHFELHESKSSLKMVELYDQFNFPSLFQSSNIECLILTVYCNWRTLQSILFYSPNLHHFQIRSSFNCSEHLSSELHFSSIRKLNLQLNGFQTNIFITLFHNAPLLRQCKLKCFIYSFKQNDINLLESKTWLQLINKYTPKLKTLEIDIKFSLDNANEKTLEMINEDFRILNFKVDFDSDNGNQCWTMTGVFNRR